MDLITRFGLEKTRFTVLMMLLILALGIASYLTIPKREDPEITIRTAVVAAAFADRERTGVPHAEPLPRLPRGEERSARGPVKHGVADDDVVLGHDGRLDDGAHHDHAARQALAHVVVGVALHDQLQPRRREGPQALPGGALQLHRQMPLLQVVEHAEALHDAAGDPRPHRPLGVLHRVAQLHLLAVAQEPFGILDRLRVIRVRHKADTRPGAPLDLIKQTRPRTTVKHRIGAVSQQKNLLQLVQRTIDRTSRGERSIIVAFFLLRAAMLFDLRKAVVFGHQDVRKRLIIPKQNVVLGLELFAEVLLKKQRFCLSGCCQKHH